MAKKLKKPEIRSVGETYFGQQMKKQQVEHLHAEIVQRFRDDAKEEIELLQRSERLTNQDFAIVINARIDDLNLADDER